MTPYGGPVVDDDLPYDHWVSRGYQQNFATVDKRVAIFDIGQGRIIDGQRPIKSNFREQGFTTFLKAGIPTDLLERAFASVEARVLNEIRTISRTRCGPQQKADTANLFAVHLVRSPAFKAFHAHIGQRYRENDVPLVAGHPSLSERFEASEGRPPMEGELLDVSLRVYDDMVGDPMHLVTTLIRQHDAMADVEPLPAPGRRARYQPAGIRDRRHPWSTRPFRPAATASETTSRSVTRIS